MLLFSINFLVQSYKYMPKIKVITMPSLSPTMTTGVINTWVKTIGQEINIGDVIAEIETDKAVMEMESPFKGVLCKILVQQGARRYSYSVTYSLVCNIQC